MLAPAAPATRSDVRTAIRAGLWQLPCIAALAIAAVAVAGLTPALIPLLALAAVTPALTAIDVREHRLPNALVLPGYLAAAAGLVGDWIRTGSLPTTALISGAAYLAFLLAFHLAGGMGMGDVKLAGALGLTAGLLSITAAVLSPLLAFVLGGVVALAVAARRGRRAALPFGPLMLAGFWLAVILAR